MGIRNHGNTESTGGNLESSKNLEYSTQPKRASCSKSAVGLLPCGHQADIRTRSHRLLRTDGNKFAASCQKACSKLIVKTFYPKA